MKTSTSNLAKTCLQLGFLYLDGQFVGNRNWQDGRAFIDCLGELVPKSSDWLNYRKGMDIPPPTIKDNCRDPEYRYDLETSILVVYSNQPTLKEYDRICSWEFGVDLKKKNGVTELLRKQMEYRLLEAAEAEYEKRQEEKRSAAIKKIAMSFTEN